MNAGPLRDGWTFCPECGQPIAPAARLCACGHPETSHDIARNGTRTRCFRYTSADGPCECSRFQAAKER